MDNSAFNYTTNSCIDEVFSGTRPGASSRCSVVVDIFRLENGKIVEHWYVIQEIPETAANRNGMF